MHGLFLGNLTS